MSEFSQISRLQEENRKALLERQQRLLTCEKYKQDYEKLEELLKTLPHKTSHEVMVPFGSVAFMPGKLIHTNEITVLLGDNWFAERSASQALEIVARRKKYLETNIAGINADIKSFDATLQFAADIQSTAEENSEVKEIKEELSLQDEERLLNRGARKAHSKAKKFGGSKKVEGLKSNIKEKMTKMDREVKPLAAEDLSLFARLDALEKEETTNAELDQLDEENSAEDIKTESGYMKKEDGVRWVQSMTAKNSDSKKKKVTWGASDIKNDAGENVDDANGDSDDDNDVQRTIAVKFSHLSTSFQGQIPEQNLQQPAVITPADIYSQFTPKQELKSILRKPSFEEKEKQTSMENLGTTQQAVTDIAKEKTVKEDLNFHKAFTGTIVEKTGIQSEQLDSGLPQAIATHPGKKPSRFKAARQKHQ